MEHGELDLALEELEIRLERLRALYEQYFLGIEKIEPAVARKDVDRRIYVLRREKIRNTAKRFKLQTIIQRYNTFQQYWQRICREIENGTYKRHLLKAQKATGQDLLTIAARKRLGRAGSLASTPPAAESAAPPSQARPAAESNAAPAPPAALRPSAAQAPSAAPSPSIHTARPLVPNSPPLPRSIQPAAARLGAAPLPPAKPSAAPPLSPFAPPASQLASIALGSAFENLDLGDIASDWDPSASRPGKPVKPTAPRPASSPSPMARAANTPAASPPPLRPRVVSAPAAPAPPPTRPAPVPRPAPAPAHPAPARPLPAPRPAPSPPAAPAPLRAPASPVTANSPRAPLPAPSPPRAPALPAEAGSPRAPRPAPAPPRAPAPAPAPASPVLAAPNPAPPKPPPSLSSALDDARIRDLHSRLQHAKQQTREGSVSLEGLARSLRATEEKLRQQHQNRRIDFDVVIRDGKAVVKPTVR